jgi:hypothetical protein
VPAFYQAVFAVFGVFVGQMGGKAMAEKLQLLAAAMLS